MEWLSKKLLYNLTDSDNQLNHQRNTNKESQGNTTVPRFFQSISFHRQRKDGANTICIWSSLRNYYHYNDALQKHETMVCSPDRITDFLDIVTGVLQGDTLAPYLFILSLEYMSINLIKENGFTQKKWEADGISQQLWQMQSTQMTLRFSQIHQHKQNPIV